MIATPVLALSTPRRLGGRPRDEHNPKKRVTQFRLAYLVVCKHIHFDEGMMLGGVDRSTLYRWIQQLKTSDEPLAVRFRAKLKSDGFL